MNQQQWMTSKDPAAMLDYLTGGRVAGLTQGRQPSARRLRLFAVACCRQIWDGTECPECLGIGGVARDPIGGPERNPDILHVIEPPDFWECQRCHGSGRIGGLTDPRSRRAVETAERFADGLATMRELDDMHREIMRWQRKEWEQSGEGPLTDAYGETIWPQWLTFPDREFPQRLPEIIIGNALFAAEQAALLRDIFTPFAPVVRQGWQTCGRCGGSGVWHPNPIHSRGCPACHGKGRVPSGQLACWLAWNDGCVKKLAELTYDLRDFDRLSILADALEEAGCEDMEILGHCRKQRCQHYSLELARDCPKCYGTQSRNNPETQVLHVRGCWVIDLLLNQK